MAVRFGTTTLENLMDIQMSNNADSRCPQIKTYPQM